MNRNKQSKTIQIMNDLFDQKFPGHRHSFIKFNKYSFEFDLKSYLIWNYEQKLNKQK